MRLRRVFYNNWPSLSFACILQRKKLFNMHLHIPLYTSSMRKRAAFYRWGNGGQRNDLLVSNTVTFYKKGFSSNIYFLKVNMCIMGTQKTQEAKHKIIHDHKQFTAWSVLLGLTCVFTQLSIHLYVIKIIWLCITLFHTSWIFTTAKSQSYEYFDDHQF